jgi:hypothetical protein
MLEKKSQEEKTGDSYSEGEEKEGRCKERIDEQRIKEKCRK